MGYMQKRKQISIQSKKYDRCNKVQDKMRWDNNTIMLRIFCDAS